VGSSRREFVNTTSAAAAAIADLAAASSAALAAVHSAASSPISGDANTTYFAPVAFAAPAADAAVADVHFARNRMTAMFARPRGFSARELEIAATVKNLLFQAVPFFQLTNLSGAT
jgi:uncharacterized protein YdbL (DUF1318 family)